MDIKSYSILIVDDDEDDCFLVKDILESFSITNRIYHFTDSTKVAPFLEELSGKIFFILCDINMPKIDGFALRKKINESEILRKKAIPFLFFSTTGDRYVVNKAYTLNIQGYFKKPSTLDEYKSVLKDIMTYWSTSELP